MMRSIWSISIVLSAGVGCKNEIKTTGLMTDLPRTRQRFLLLSVRSPPPIPPLKYLIDGLGWYCRAGIGRAVEIIPQRFFGRLYMLRNRTLIPAVCHLISERDVRETKTSDFDRASVSEWGVSGSRHPYPNYRENGNVCTSVRIVPKRRSHG